MNPTWLLSGEVPVVSPTNQFIDQLSPWQEGMAKQQVIREDPQIE